MNRLKGMIPIPKLAAAALLALGGFATPAAAQGSIPTLEVESAHVAGFATFRAITRDRREIEGGGLWIDLDIPRTDNKGCGDRHNRMKRTTVIPCGWEETAQIIGVFTDHAPYSELSGPYALVFNVRNFEFRENTGPDCPAGSPPNPAAMPEPGWTASLRINGSAIQMVSGTASRTAAGMDHVYDFDAVGPDRSGDAGC